MAKIRVADKSAQGASRSRADKEWGGGEKEMRTIPNASRHGGAVKRSQSKGKEGNGKQAERLGVAQERREERETVEFA